MPFGRLRLVGLADHILLDLDELVDAQQPAHVLARAPRLAPEAGRKAGVEDRQFVGLDDLARMERGQHHLGGPGEPQIVVGQFVGLLRWPGNWPWLRNACSRAIAGTVIGVKPASAIFSSAQAISLVSSSASRALEAIGAAARHLRHPRQVAPVVLLDQRDMVERLEVELRRLADGADDGVEALVGPDRRALVGNAGKPQHQRFQLRFLARQLALERATRARPLPSPAAELGLLLGRSRP